jgi:hypothetical protein
MTISQEALDASLPGLHALTVQAILDGAHQASGTDAAWFPRTGNLDDRAILIANHEISKKLLEEAGFEKVCGVVAGLNSGSSWINTETGESGEINVRDWNIVTAFKRESA